MVTVRPIAEHARRAWALCVNRGKSDDPQDPRGCATGEDARVLRTGYRSFCTMALMKAGVVPQQPPMKLAPACTRAGTWLANSSGLV